jgi:hypothetical protein
LPVKGFVSITRLYVPNEFVREMLSPSLWCPDPVPFSSRNFIVAPALEYLAFC